MREDRIEQGEGDFTPEPRPLPQTNMTEWMIHPYGHLDGIADFGPVGHHHRTIQDERRYKQAKKKRDRRAQRAAKKARKRNRR